jgi:cytochrome c oxidase subunit III
MSATPSKQFDSTAQQELAATFGMWVFLASEVLFFGPLLFGYLYVRTQFPDASAAASRHTDMLLGTLNTALLLTSSLCMALAASARGAGRTRRASWLLAATAALGVAFLAIKGWEWHAELTRQLFPGPSFRPADAGTPALLDGMELFFILYFALTGLHALHLMLGVLGCGVLAVALGRGAGGFGSAHRVELVGLYWHFVDVAWIFLYPLLYLVGRAGGSHG